MAQSSETDKLPIKEVAVYINNLLKEGITVTPLQIMDIIEKKCRKIQEQDEVKQTTVYRDYIEGGSNTKIKDYIWHFNSCYGDIIKYAIRELNNQIKSQDEDPKKILLPQSWELDKRMKTYKYSKKGFSAFEDNKARKNEVERTHKDIAIKTSEELRMISAQEFLIPSQIDKRNIDYAYILAKQMLENKEMQYKEELEKWINQLKQLKEEKGDGWVSEYARYLLKVTNGFKNISRSNLYAELLIEYADFVYNYQTPGEVLPNNMKIEKYAELKYLETINIAIENQNTEKHLLYLSKYIEFLISTSQYEKLVSIFEDIDEIYKNYKKEDNIDIYQKILYLRAKYLCKKCRYSESERLYEEVYDIKTKALGGCVNTENIEEQILLSDIINDRANLYHDKMEYKKAMPLYEQALKIRRDCANINRERYISDVSASLYNISLMYMYDEKIDEAKKCIEEAIEYDRELAETHPEVYKYLINLSWDLLRRSNILLLLAEGKEKVMEPFQEIISINEKLYNQDNIRFKESYSYVLSWQATTYQFLELDDEALEIHNKVLCILGEDEKYIKRVISSMVDLADIYVKKEDFYKSDMYYKKALELLYKIYINDKTCTNFEAYLNVLVKRIPLYINDKDELEKLKTQYKAKLDEYVEFIIEEDSMALEGFTNNEKDEFEKLRTQYIAKLEEYVESIIVENSINALENEFIKSITED